MFDREKAVKTNNPVLEYAFNEVDWGNRKHIKRDGSFDSRVLLADNVMGCIHVIWYSETCLSSQLQMSCYGGAVTKMRLPPDRQSIFHIIAECGTEMAAAIGN